MEGQTNQNLHNVQLGNNFSNKLMKKVTSVGTRLNLSSLEKKVRYRIYYTCQLGQAKFETQDVTVL